MNSFHLGKNKRLKEERFFPRSQSCLSADPPIPRPELCPPYPVAPPSLFSPCKSSSWKQHCLAFPSIRIEGFEDWEGFTNHCGWPAGRMTNAPFFFFLGQRRYWRHGTWARNGLSTLMSWFPWLRSKWWLNLFSSPQISRGNLSSTKVSVTFSFSKWHCWSHQIWLWVSVLSPHWTAQKANQSTAASRWVLRIKEDNGIKRRTDRTKPSNIFILSVLVFARKDPSLLFLATESWLSDYRTQCCLLLFSHFSDTSVSQLPF